VIFDTALAIQAQILHDGAVGKVADVLAGDRVQPAAPRRSGQLQHRAVRAIHHDGGSLRGALLAERVAEMPDGAGVWCGFWCGNSGHTANATAVTLCPMMARSADVVVDLDGVRHGPTAPLVRAVDPVLTNGDGVFETTLLRGGRPCRLDAHLARLDRSAAIAGLPRQDPARWRAAVDIAAAHWHAGASEATGYDVAADGVLRLLCGRAVSFVTVSAVPARAVAARRDGLAVVTLNPGPRGALAGAKSLSYARNVAALREAERRGAGDAIFVDDDGTVLEGPRSSVVIAQSEILLSPPPTLPILAGTTVAALFEIAPRTAYRVLTVADLLAAEGVWLLSAVTLAARVHTLDGVALPQAPAAGEPARLVNLAMSR